MHVIGGKPQQADWSTRECASIEFGAGAPFTSRVGLVVSLPGNGTTAAMDRATTHETPASAQRERWMFEFALDGDLRFISHRDTMRLFQRAFARTTLPVRFTEGFNPHPRLSLPLPRPVGVASDAEAIVVTFEHPINGDEALAELARQMPDGIRMINARRLLPSERTQPVSVRYRLDLGENGTTDMDGRINDLMAASSIEVIRADPSNGSTRELDAKPFLEEMTLIDGAVEFVLLVRGDGGIKPAEIAALIGFDPGAVNHRIRRIETQWEK